MWQQVYTIFVLVCFISLGNLRVTEDPYLHGRKYIPWSEVNAVSESLKDINEIKKKEKNINDQLIAYAHHSYRGTLSLCEFTTTNQPQQVIWRILFEAFTICMHKVNLTLFNTEKVKIDL